MSWTPRKCGCGADLGKWMRVCHTCQPRNTEKKEKEVTGLWAHVDDMVSMYTNGDTLEKIGIKYGVTRERIRQYLSSRGITRENNPRHEFIVTRNLKRREEDLAAQNERSLARWGVSLSERKELTTMGVLSAYRNHERAATRDGYSFEMSLKEWWCAWKDSGHWDQRGKGKDKYVMTRIDRTLPLNIGNYEIITLSKMFSMVATETQQRRQLQL
jgi:hypothetical protein